MEIQVTIPEEIKTVEIRNIKIILGRRIAVIETWINGLRNREEIDLQPLIDNATATQLTVIKGFLKMIVATSMNVDISEIPDKIFTNK